MGKKSNLNCGGEHEEGRPFVRCVDFPSALGYIFSAFGTTNHQSNNRKDVHDGHAQYGGDDEASAEDAREDG